MCVRAAFTVKFPVHPLCTTKDATICINCCISCLHSIYRWGAFKTLAPFSIFFKIFSIAAHLLDQWRYFGISRRKDAAYNGTRTKEKETQAHKKALTADAASLGRAQKISFLKNHSDRKQSARRKNSMSHQGTVMPPRSGKCCDIRHLCRPARCTGNAW